MRFDQAVEHRPEFQIVLRLVGELPHDLAVEPAPYAYGRVVDLLVVDAQADGAFHSYVFVVFRARRKRQRRHTEIRKTQAWAHRAPLFRRAARVAELAHRRPPLHFAYLLDPKTEGLTEQDWLEANAGC